MNGRTRKRALHHSILLAVGIAGAIVVNFLSGPVSPALFVLSEGAAGALALAVGVLSLARFRADRDPIFAFVGAGLLGAAVLHVQGAWIGATPAFDGFAVPSAWIGFGPGLVVGILALAGGWFGWRSSGGATPEPGRPAAHAAPEPGPILLAAAALTALLTAVPLLVGFAPAFDAGVFPGGAQSLLPGTLLLGALGLHFARDRPKDADVHAVGLMLLLTALSHLAFRAFANDPADPSILVASVVQMAGYAVLGASLVRSAAGLFAREASAASELRSAKADLVREVRQRKAAERASQEVESRLKDFLDHARDLIQSTDVDGRILYVNETWKRIMGYSEEELREKTIFDMLHPASKASYREVMDRVFQGEPVTDFDVTLQARDGGLVICSGSSNCRVENGRPVSARSILRDRSEERRAEEELQHFQANLQAVFESTGDAIWSVDRQHRLLTMNTAYALLLEVVTGRIPKVGDSLETLVSEEALGWFQSCYDRALAGSRFSAARQERVDGQMRTFECYFNPIEGAEGGPRGVVVYSRDVTRRKRVEEALLGAKKEAEEASRTKSQFLANMSHELRTPLNSIIGFANILLKKHGDEMADRERGFMERILVNGKHLLTLINEILDLSKIEAGRMELQVESVDLRKLAQETMAQLEPQVTGTPVELLWEVEGDPAPARTDRGKLKQVLINLVANALKFTEEGSVTVRVRTADDGRTPTRIEVVDTGIGIPEDRLDAIFHAFQQADAGTSRRFGGTGLGLTISRSLCDLMGYQLHVDSVVGEGSTFAVLLGSDPDEPVENRLEELDQPPVARWANPTQLPSAQTLRDKKVLVVDDEADSRDLLAHYLVDLGCRVVTAVDGVDGLEVARRESPDLITVDLMMPRMSGWDFLRAVRDDPQLRDTPVVVVSIVAEEGGGQVLGSVDLLDKPVEREELARTLARNLAKGSRRVLVVEDNPDARLLLIRYLREAGLQVDGVDNGDDAVEYLQRHPVDLILLDLLMPGMDGLTLLRRIRESDDLTRIPVVVLTAKDLEEGELELLSEEGVQVIQKGNEVERHLRSVLDGLFGVVSP